MSGIQLMRSLTSVLQIHLVLEVHRSRRVRNHYPGVLHAHSGLGAAIIYTIFCYDKTLPKKFQDIADCTFNDRGIDKSYYIRETIVGRIITCSYHRPGNLISMNKRQHVPVHLAHIRHSVMNG